MHYGWLSFHYGWLCSCSLSVYLSYTDEDEVGDKQQRKAEKLKKKMMHSSLVKELREELWDMPEEIKV